MWAKGNLSDPSSSASSWSTAKSAVAAIFSSSLKLPDFTIMIELKEDSDYKSRPLGCWDTKTALHLVHNLKGLSIQRRDPIKIFETSTTAVSYFTHN